MSLDIVYQEMSVLHGISYARRWLKARQQAEEASAHPQVGSRPVTISQGQESIFPHESHKAATELLEGHREALGSAYSTLHLLARWSIEHATDRDPAPHLMTCYWTLEEALGLSERTLRRHLVEDQHSWSSTVSKFIDTKLNYGPMLDGKDAEGKDRFRTVITGMVIRFFPAGRQSKNARVKCWGRRDLLKDADAGRTKPARQVVKKGRYRRQKGQMSAYRSIKEQSSENNWLLVKLGQMVSDRVEIINNFGNLYADIPANHLLNALSADLELGIQNAVSRGASVKRARSLWVNTAASLLANRFNDDRPLPHHLSDRHVTHHDGFTDLWRRILWTALKSELYGGTRLGWRLVTRMITLATESKLDGVLKPVALAWAAVKNDLEALRRDFGSGMAGVCLN